MVRLKSLTCSGLFSYASESPIEFSEHVVIVGPNNAGKSNLFRVIRVLSDTLSGTKNHLSGSEMSPCTSNPYVEAEVHLSLDECHLLSEFFAYQPIEGLSDEGNAKLRIQSLPDQSKISHFLDSIKIRIEWERTPDNLAVRPRAYMWFLKCGFKLSGLLDTGIFQTPQDESPPVQSGTKPMPFNKFLTQIFSSDDPEKKAASFFADRTVVHKSVPLSSNVIDGLPERTKTRARDLLYQLQQKINNDTFSLSHVFGAILSEGIVHASENRNLLRKPLVDTYERIFATDLHDDFSYKYNEMLEKSILYANMEYTKTLEHDGSNIAQLLFSLKNSPHLSDKDRFQTIQNEFKKIFQSQELDVDVSLRYVQKRRARHGPSNNIPIFPEISITEPGLPERILLDQVGGGVRGVLYLLTVVHGIKDSVVLLDEPGINLHPSMLKAVISTLKSSNHENQFLIITHSPELLSNEMFDEDGDVVYIKKMRNQSQIYRLDDETRNEFTTRRRQLGHQIDPRIFFSKLVILTEGPSDQNLLKITNGLANNDPKYNLSLNDTVIISVDGKQNFPKYINLLKAFGIPYVILADYDAKVDVFQNEPTEVISKNGITSNRCIFLINHDLENLMKETDSSIFEQASHKGGRSKVAVVLEFCKLMQEKNPEKPPLDPIVEFLDHCMSQVYEPR